LHEADGRVKPSHGSRWERLKEFDVIFLVDDSPTMWNDWAEALSFLGEAIPKCIARTEKGVSIFFTHHWTGEPSWYDEQWKAEWPAPSGYLGIKYATRAAAEAHGHPPEASAEFVFDALTPPNNASAAAETDAQVGMGRRLAHILRPYVRAYVAGTAGDERFKHMANVDLVVVTNGADGDGVETETLAVAEELNACGAPSSQVGIQFVQVGRSDARGAMLRDLDSDIVLSDRDMIDTVLYEHAKDPRTGRMTDDGLYKVLLGGVSRKVDMKRLENGHFVGKR
jgi:hypothetical protein